MSEAIQRAKSGGLVIVNPRVPLTPAETNELLQLLNNELEISGEAVRSGRTEASRLKKAYEDAKTELLMSSERPRVGRTADAVTVAERDAWIALQTDEKYSALYDAEVLLENAIGYAWQVNRQVSLAQSLNNNATTGLTSFTGGGR
ncbi:hypothetical protein AB0F88_39745 [Streptosporangium sp. NPDC023963]|uniref:hypothetical protein n=1 Tax=Streptosporangium sp. NPDC023963 TaxID=3155608 RepID=UPI00343384BF